MAILEVILSGTYFNQQTISRWNYVSAGIPAAVSLSFALASALGGIFDEVAIPPAYPADTLLGMISGLTGNEWDWQQLTVLNPFSATDFYQTPFVPAYGGSQGGEQLSPVMAFGWRTNQVRRDVARGTKRLPGVGETQVTSGGGFVGGTVTAMENLAAKMSEVLEYDDEGNILSFAPAVCGKERYNPVTGLASPTGTAYRYYASEAIQLTHTAVSVTWQPYATVRGQASRQYGHGR